MQNFKLIAIVPLQGCDSKFSKKLSLGKSYQFCQQYKIHLDNQGTGLVAVDRVEGLDVPQRLYKLKNEISVSVSAVVGKNGTGKSTLMELLYRAIYLLGTKQAYDEKPILETALGGLQRELRFQQGDLMNLLTLAGIGFEGYPVDISITLPVLEPEQENIELFAIDLIQRHKLKVTSKEAGAMKGVAGKVAGRLKTKIADTERLIENEKQRERELSSGFNVSIIYEVDNIVRELHCSSGEVGHFEIYGKSTGIEKSPVSNFDLANFFYTISLNYSHHGLNADTLGIWINKLFHKNDGYRTPVVINPMRKRGNFDINDEIKLSRERLMSTLVFDLLHKSSVPLLGKYTVSSFLFHRKHVPAEAVGTPEDFERLSYSDLMAENFSLGHGSAERANGEAALNYMERKIGRVAENYPFLLDKKLEQQEALKVFLKEDKTHVTKKIRQTLNYLQANSGKVDSIWSTDDEMDPATVSLSPKLLLEYIGLFGGEKEKMGPDKLIEFALPGFFNIDFEFSDDQGNLIKLSEMSSGEQQLIFNSNSILYHLYNIQSVHSQDEKEEGGSERRLAYRNVNVILDEMELYYHPEMQRRLVSELLKCFERLTRNGGITGINVCILTHSPFILSDIPLQQVLRLDGDPDVNDLEKQQTFGANIHDLLRKEFALEDGFMGEFARGRINQVIDSLREHQSLKEQPKRAGAKYPYLETSRFVADARSLREFGDSSMLSEGECREIIGLVGEPVLYQSLMELFLQVFPEKRLNFIDQQLEYLSKLKRL